MPRMGRPRQTRKDLPTGLYVDKWGTYFFRASTGGRRFVSIGKVTREQAIRRFVKETILEEQAEDGTVGELITRYIRDELPRRMRLGKIKAITAEEYKRQAPALTTLFGDRKYAPTPAESARPDVLRRADVVSYLRGLEGVRGAVLANRRIALLSVVFENAADLGICTFNPCKGAERNPEHARKNVLPQTTVAELMAAAYPSLRLITRLAELTALRKVDLRALTLPQIRDGLIVVTLSKRKKNAQPKVLEFEITPAIQAVLDEAATLPGRARSLYVFPTRRGTPYRESGLQSAWRRAKTKAGLTGVDAVFRDLRTTELNEVKRAGGDATAAAGHADRRTTDRHYLTVPTRIKPRR